ncbi:class 1 fructose-bisphosphatase [Roseibium limicola]|uniref:Fructose-1,6-bisphosphatase class 1 n=1 Tax=Roseibium limicola TaxID=2816037 RepID=A0A939J9C0_9HYPH|nr:class 1 fructose-bisphosphatase [Roseibium limicola]MBO0346221.1 class 1 fructose-bisphosphatase [Roseibium limicola]
MLKLPNDTEIVAETLSDHLRREETSYPAAAVVRAISEACAEIAERLAAGGLPGDPAAIVGVNESGDKQKALDVATHDYMVEVLRKAGVRQVLSEEAENVIALNSDGAFDVAIDPIDGSGSIGTGAPLGTLFTVIPAGPTGPEGFYQPGRKIAAAGYASFGHSADFGFSLGNGLHLAVFDWRIEEFRMWKEGHEVPNTSRVLAYNASNHRHWEPGIRQFVEDALEGKRGPLNADYNMRWLAAAVGDMHRIVLQGGLFLYPGDSRPGYEDGKLRLIYEAIPMAFLMEQAGGQATSGRVPILDMTPTSLHQNVPLIFGSSSLVETLGAYLAFRA